MFLRTLDKVRSFYGGNFKNIYDLLRLTYVMLLMYETRIKKGERSSFSQYNKLKSDFALTLLIKKSKKKLSEEDKLFVSQGEVRFKFILW